MKNLLLIKIVLTTTISTLITIATVFIFNSAVITTITGFLSALISSILVFLFLKPLEGLVKTAENFIAGQFNQRTDIRSGDELEILGNSFNTFAGKLSGHFHNLETEKDQAVTENNRLSEVLSSMIDGIIALDFNKNIIFSNKAFEEITGYTQSEIQNQNVEKFIHLFVDNEEIMSKSYCQINFSKSAKMIGKNGKESKISIMTTKTSQDSQTNVNCILIFHDLSKEEELERMKLDFVSMASHELRTPLTSIIGYLSVFASENKDKIAKEELDLVDKALISSRQLLILVQNLLSVNKIERVQMSVSVTPVDYLPIISKVIDNIKNLSAQKNIVLTLQLPTTDLPKVLTDPIKTEEVITNLIANAINYTNPGGKVDIALEVSPTEVKTSIIDTGIGIPKEAISHLFSKFFRASNSTQQASKGTGLGLYISKSIIEKLNGKIWVESEAGKGSKFSFTLPLASSSFNTTESNKFVQQEIQSGALNY